MARPNSHRQPSAQEGALPFKPRQPDPNKPVLPGERLQKLMAEAGIASRRACEAIIDAGRVTVNGVVAALGAKALPHDVVCLDGQPIRARQTVRVVALNKPVGFVSDRGSERLNRSALDLVPAQERLFAVGRLDKDSSGLMLLTNDGDLTYQLTHPSFEHEKEYVALVIGTPSPGALRQWRAGFVLDGEDTPTVPAQVLPIDPPHAVPGMRSGVPDCTWLRIVLREGRKRQIRRAAAQLGYPVLQLIRVRIGPVVLGGLKSGQWRDLAADEIAALKNSE